jgi:hypothetical protein
MSEKIRGYRDLSDEDIGLMNSAKEKADSLDEFICTLEIRRSTLSRIVGHPESKRPPPDPNSIDGRELALARTKFQEGFMHLVRSIAQPRSF